MSVLSSTRGTVAAYREKWPEENLQEAEDGKSYAVRPHDPVILMSDDAGDTWRIALTRDFAQRARRIPSFHEDSLAIALRRSRG